MDSNSRQCQFLFREPFRLLSRSNGFLVVIPMAEYHSLYLILHSCMEYLQRRDCRMSITELHPLSGSQRPFGIVFETTTTTDTESCEADIDEDNDGNHHVDSKNQFLQTKEIQSSYRWNDINQQETTISVGEWSPEAWIESVHTKCQASQQSFQHQIQQKTKTKNLDEKMLLTLDLKPWDSSTNLELLYHVVVTTPWLVFNHPQQEKEPQKQKVIDVCWQTSNKKQRVIPIGYGISKLVLQCIVRDEDVEALLDAMNEWDGGGIFPDGVQSVDIDWSQSNRIIAVPLTERHRINDD